MPQSLLLTLYHLLPADTDSLCLAVADVDLQKCLRPEFADRWDEIAAFLFEQPDSSHQQSGRFKLSSHCQRGKALGFSSSILSLQIEGVFDESYWRSPKAYYLANKNPDAKDEIVRRLRSIPRKHHSSLEKCHFGQNPALNQGVVRGLTMAPSLGLQIIMSMQGKSLSKAYNLTRSMTVRGDCFQLCVFKLKWALLLQDCCHSLALQ
jgi:hypothetical protein